MRLSLLVCLLVTVAAVFDAKAADSSPTKSFTYKKTKQANLAIYVHYPPGWKEADKRPAIVFFFGGGFQFGSVKQFEPQAAYFASRGMVAARADYRVKSRHGVEPDACVEDAKSAVRWLRQNAAKLGIDPNRIVASGSSSGGYLAACSARPGIGRCWGRRQHFVQAQRHDPVLPVLAVRQRTIQMENRSHVALGQRHATNVDFVWHQG